MKLTSAMEQYVQDTKDGVQDLIRAMAPIPAPSHHEDLRVEFVKNWMEKEGAKGVYVDEAKNVIWPVNVKENNDIYVFMAHTDVVFPDTTELPFKEDDKYMYCPGVGDDTARLAVLLYAYRFFHKAGMKPAGDFGVLIVANSCEEGLGNLDGTRNIIKNFGSRIKGFYTVDGGLKNIVTIAVGSHRYKVTVRTEGGHSYAAFGNRNAIRCLASMIDTLYSVKVPQNGDSKTTYNVGGISVPELFTMPEEVERARTIMGEVCAAAKLRGFPLPASLTESQMRRTEVMGDFTPSTAVDFLRKRPIEYDAIWGIPLQRAMDAGASVPAMSRLCAEIRHCIGME